jgi:4-hydroxythreonine-4-phosphate dehydrogenase
LGLNPHAGDGGVIGKKKLKLLLRQSKNFLIMEFWLSDLFRQTVSSSRKIQKFDAVLAMYHDQGLAPFKTLAYEEGVNYTAGLPFIRTSPDHGVAYDIAGKNVADEQSFTEAIFTAIKIFKNRRNTTN